MVLTEKLMVSRITVNRHKPYFSLLQCVSPLLYSMHQDGEQQSYNTMATCFAAAQKVIQVLHEPYDT